MFVDERLAGADMYGGIITIAPGAELHWHPIGERQFFLFGDGPLLDADGNEAPIVKGGSARSGHPRLSATPAPSRCRSCLSTHRPAAPRRSCFGSIPTWPPTSIRQ